MSTVRIQVRRGTSTEWSSVNPILAAGEMGLESDTNYVKFGNGTDNWLDLPYANVPAGDLANTLTDYVLVGDVGNPGGPAGPLTVDGKVPYSQIPNIDELSQDAVNAALVAGTGITKVYNDGANTITVAVDTSVIATKAELAEVSQDSINDALVAGVGLDKTYDDNANTITLDIDSTVATKTYADNAASAAQTAAELTASNALSSHASDTTGVHGIDDTSELATKAFAAELLTNATKTNITITGNKNGLTITAENGVSDSTTSDLAEGTNLYFTDERAQDAVAAAIEPDSSINVSYNDTDNKIEIAVDTNVIASKSYTDTQLGYKADINSPTFTGIPHAPNPSTGSNGTQIATTSFVQALISDIVDGAPTALNTLNEIASALQNDESTLSALITTVDGKQEKVANISSSEIATLDGITGNIQDQLDAKLEISDAASTYATANNPNFTGTISMPAGSITSGMILNGTLVNEDISSSAEIDPTKIAGTAITTQSNMSITTNLIDDQAISTEKIADNAVTTIKIEANAITNELLAGDAVETVNIKNANVTNDKLALNAVQTNVIQDSAVTNAKLAGDAVETINIKDGNVTHAKLAADAVETSNILDDAVTAAKLAGDAVDTVNIIDGSVTHAKLAVASVETANIKDLNVTTDKLADSSVTSGKIASGAVGTTDIADSAVVNSKLSSDAVETINIKDANVTNAKLAIDSVDTAQIKTDAVTNDKLAANAVNTAELADDAVTTDKIANATIVNANISETAAIAQSKIDGLSTSLGLKADAADLTNHLADTTTVHGIADTSKLVTTDDTGTVTSTMIANGTIVNADINASAAIALSKLATDPLARANHTGTQASSTISDFDEAAQDAVGNNVGTGLSYNDTTGAISVNTSTIQARVSGVSDTEIGYLDGVTSAIQTQIDSKSPTASPTFTGTVTVPTLAVTTTATGITKSMVGLGNVDNTSDANKPISTATQSALDLKAPKASPTFTGTLTAADVEITGNLNVTGTTTTVDSQNLAVTDSLIYLAKNQYSTDVLDIGIYGAYGTTGNNGGNHPHTGLVRDASDGKWKLISGGAEPTSSEVDFTTATKDTLVIGALDATSATIGNVSNTELQYLDGVTSAIQTQLDAKAPLASPTFTGTVTLPSGTVTSTMILDGTIVNADINASAAIAQSKIANLTTDLAAKAPTAAPTFTGLVTVSASGIAFSDKTQTLAGVPSRTPIASTISTSPAQLAGGLQDSMVPLSGAVTITINDTTNAAYSIGESIDFFQVSGTGATFAKAGSVNLLYTPGLALRTTYSSATVQKITSTDWLVYGDLKA
jgi:hypothetical protein